MHRHSTGRNQVSLDVDELDIVEVHPPQEYYGDGPEAFEAWERDQRRAAESRNVNIIEVDPDPTDSYVPSGMATVQPDFDKTQFWYPILSASQGTPWPDGRSRFSTPGTVNKSGDTLENPLQLPTPKTEYDGSDQESVTTSNLRLESVSAYPTSQYRRSSLYQRLREWERQNAEYVPPPEQTPKPPCRYSAVTPNRRTSYPSRSEYLVEYMPPRASTMMTTPISHPPGRYFDSSHLAPPAPTRHKRH